MGNLFFSTKGRIGPAAFQSAAIILIAIGFAINMVPFLSFSLGMIVSILSLVILWPWICLWVKRLHDAGKSGWMVLVVLLVLIGVNIVVGRLMLSMLVDQAAMQEAVLNAGADVMGAMKASAEFTKPTIIPSAIAGAVTSFVVVFLGNKVLKSDPEENQFGGPTS